MRIQPFKIEIPQSALTDLHDRLTRTRWPDEISGTGWKYGAQLTYMKDLLQYWLTEFDWRAQEQMLNRFQHFHATIDGLRIHFIHERGEGPNPVPIIITHGWPGSFAEMLKILPMLADPDRFGGDPADAFDVVVPSMPGYGFSDRPREPGMNPARIADLWVQLMQKGLNYPIFGAQGGDWGASVATALGLNFSEAIIGLHLNYIPGSYEPYLGADARQLSADERKFIKYADLWYDSEGGYAHIQKTKPQTLAYALHDSPSGLAAWIVEKFCAWADCHGDPERCFTKDELLTNISLYWFTETINSANRIYYETKVKPLHFRREERVQPPCGVIHFAKEAPFPPREWVERGYNVVRWTERKRGGHFAAMEEPEALVEDIRAFFREHRPISQI